MIFNIKKNKIFKLFKNCPSNETNQLKTPHGLNKTFLSYYKKQSSVIAYQLFFPID